MNPKISIIVPIYNVESYLRQCLDSILAQTFTNFELILIDDGSPDNCGSICDEYAGIDQRIRVIHKINGGVSSARNIGIELAKGEYIAFVDPDDVIERNMYEVLVHYSKKHEADMVVCQYTLIDKESKTKKVPQIWEQVDCVVDNETIIHKIFPNLLVNNTFSLVPCYNKLYKKSVFDENHIRFDETKNYGEDKRLNFTLLPLINSLVFINQPLYIYIRHQRDSLSRIFQNDYHTYILEDKNFNIEICKKYHLYQCIDTVRRMSTTNILLYAQNVVNFTGITSKRKKEILSKIINNQEFKRDIAIYKTNSFYYKLLKYLCILRTEKYLAKIIQWKDKLKSTMFVT